jgi:Rab9 effector protein with kelch motifs
VRTLEVVQPGWEGKKKSSFSKTCHLRNGALIALACYSLSEMADWELHPFLSPVDTPLPRAWYVLSDWEAEQCKTTEAGEAKAGPGQGPAPRLGHSCCPTSATELLLFAGATLESPLNDVHLFDLTNFEWRPLECSGKAPALRYDHGAMFLPTLAKMVVFGGAQAERNLCDIHVLDISTRTWTSPKVSGSAPSPRTAHAVAAFETQLVVWAGGKQGMDPVDTSDVYFFDVPTSTWKRVKGSGVVPPPRHGHSMTVIGSRMFVFGGMAGSTFFGDLYVFDLLTHTWSCPDTAGLPPSARSGHAAAALGAKLYVFGGLGLHAGAPTSLSDIHVFDTATMSWAPVAIQGPSVAGRMDFTLLVAHIRPGHAVTAANEGSAGRVARASRAGKGGKPDVSASESQSGARGAADITDITDMFGRDGLVLGGEAGAVLPTPAQPAADSFPASDPGAEPDTASAGHPTSQGGEEPSPLSPRLPQGAARILDESAAAVAADAAPDQAHDGSVVLESVAPRDSSAREDGLPVLIAFGGVSADGSVFGDLLLLRPE